MSEQDPDFQIRSFEYQGSAEAWERILTVADHILRADGSEGENGLVDVRWENDFFRRKFTLIRRDVDAVRHYWLRFPDQLSEMDERHDPVIAFESDKTHVTGLFGDAVEMYAGYTSVDEKFEHAEVDLMSYLMTHPAAAGT